MTPPVPPCVYCRQHAAMPAFFPFCSERCKMADLGRWLKGDYRVGDDPSEDDPFGSGEDAPGSGRAGVSGGALASEDIEDLL